ncbi:hypothetical protein [Psychromicrobium lacuslunae]|uniref:Uncharacterized protein n=1 Tax=Psychromicrobium lacuslunae TaxID=1618207 RepID=A0A0D4BVM7_9MICC|nr:hypothetical protein [Psychromicrobium lacuslunae]AJT40374.1 hypothetical protein UM93_00250 [Psychromicrobium lacuslunae]
MPAEVFSTVLKVAPGGIMTDEVGVITGEVEIESSLDDTAPSPRAVARCRYDQANEWYSITDAARSLDSAEQLQDFHQTLVEKFQAG